MMVEINGPCHYKLQSKQRLDRSYTVYQNKLYYCLYIGQKQLKMVAGNISQVTYPIQCRSNQATLY